MSPTPAHHWGRRNPIIATFLGLLLWALVLSYGEDIQSCRRTQSTRKTQVFNLRIFKTILWADATRAVAYSRVDPNRAGAAVNRRYATERIRALKSLDVPDVPVCFPIPQV